ncbi:MAG TPA: flagellar assembly peptidoglycan hydrolase FlgJ [Pseudolabrys sp.]|jgi:Rod binding domain-containing protein|nr:flagellar assembly peptidoglycan hydrolase FlgJ [Pseudolabrys sp.]
MASTITLPAPGLSPADLFANVQAAAAKIDTPVKAKAMAAARNFEAVFLNTMFQSMQTGIDGDGPFGGSGASGVWRSMLTDQYARQFSKAGGVGIAAHVYQSLLAHQEGHS